MYSFGHVGVCRLGFEESIECFLCAPVLILHQSSLKPITFKANTFGYGLVKMSHRDYLTHKIISFISLALALRDLALALECFLARLVSSQLINLIF